MLFNSIEFIILFISVCSIFIIIKNRKFQHLFLLIVSYFFFYYTSNYLVSLLVFSTLLDFYMGKMIGSSSNLRNKKIFLGISLAGNLGILGFFKYADFGISQIHHISTSLGFPIEISLLELALPIGISFYTFQTISYTVDIYRGQLTPSKSLREFAVFVSFFPQLVAGPILRAKDFLPQLREKTEKVKDVGILRMINIQNPNVKLGVTLMAFGFFKKMFVADNVSLFVDSVFMNPMGLESFTIILGTIAFGIQIYADFSGYSDIAIGAALILGFKIPQNFNKPYFATSPVDFWRRWHISLSSWLRDYLYIPLGGNKKSPNRTYLNLFIVMFLGGLWHGASWNFVIWGMMHGLYLAIHKIIGNKIPFLKNHPFFRSKIGILFSIFVTQYFVFMAWIPFRVRDTNEIIYSIQKYIFLDFQITETFQVILSEKIPIMIMIVFIILHFISYKNGNLLTKISNYPLKYWALFLIGTILTILFFYVGNSEDFVYFQF
jgi:alginate O-acetyltransferase complex protein AlgI